MLDLPGPDLSATLTVLTAMLAPTLLLSACGTFVLSTSNRLGRVIDRVRALSEKFDQLSSGAIELALMTERRVTIEQQMGQLMFRATLLQRSLTLLYLAASAFVATSVALGILALRQTEFGWVAVGFAMLGGAFFLIAGLLLILEARLALHGLKMEMGFLRRLVDFQRTQTSGPEATFRG